MFFSLFCYTMCNKVGLVSQGRSDLDPNKSAIEEISQGEDTLQVGVGEERLLS